VIQHVERAEIYLIKGRDEKDSAYFNDVIYRTNQAYEGILKEAYGLLAGKGTGKLRTVDLENHFAKESILSPRVSDAFQKYRQDWRNPSTHDHRLSFTEQDATLALSTISTFVYLLVDQMIEVRASEKQRKRTDKALRTVSRKRPRGPRMTLVRRVDQALMNHALSQAVRSLSKKAREVEIIGTIRGHLAATLPDVDVVPAMVGGANGEVLTPDIVVTNGQTIVVEVKRLTARPGRQVAEGFAQLEMYLEALEAREGILYLVPYKPQEEMMVAVIDRETSRGLTKIHLVTPPSAIQNADELLISIGAKKAKPAKETQ
jgi:hypothetical protein